MVLDISVDGGAGSVVVAGVFAFEVGIGGALAVGARLAVGATASAERGGAGGSAGVARWVADAGGEAGCGGWASACEDFGLGLGAAGWGEGRSGAG